MVSGMVTNELHFNYAEFQCQTAGATGFSFGAKELSNDNNPDNEKLEEITRLCMCLQ